MKRNAALIFVFAGLLAAAPAKFTGVITDEMCGADHAMMNVKPDAKCVTECVKAGSKYALNVNGKVYKLSNQALPVKFPAQRVTVTGTLKGDTIQVESIAPAK